MAHNATAREFRSQLTPPLVGLYAASGGDVAALAKKYGLPPDVLALKEVALKLSDWHALAAEVDAALGDPFLGLHLAKQLQRGHYGVLEFTVRSCPNLREALQRVCRYSALLNAIAVYELHESVGVARWVNRIPGAPLAHGRVGNEFGIALIVRISRELSTAALTPRQVWFAHPKPADVSELAAWLGTDDFTFDAGENAFTFDAALLEQAMIATDPELLAVLEPQAAQLAAARPRAEDLTGRVREQIRKGLEQGDASIDAVAKALATSTRTLQRSLQGEGSGFQPLVEQVREELARAYVKTSRMNFSEIAWVLGYSDLSTFLRAFKRWTGQTPGQFRGP